MPDPLNPMITRVFPEPTCRSTSRTAGMLPVEINSSADFGLPQRGERRLCVGPKILQTPLQAIFGSTDIGLSTINVASERGLSVALVH